MAADPRATARIKKRKEEKLSLNKPKYKRGDNFDNTSNSSRAAAIADSSLFKPKTDKPKKPTYNTKDEYKPSSSKASDKKASNEISDDEMKSIDRQIKAKIKANKASDSKVEITDKEIEDIAKKATGTGVVPKVDTKGKKRGLVFGKDAKFRPFGGVIARALLGDDEKFGGERGLIDFVRTKKKPVKKQAGGMMKAKGYSRGGVTGKKRTVSRAAPREEKLAAGRRAAAARAAAGYSQRTPSAGSKEAGPSRARSGAGTGRSISELSDAQKNLLRSVQSTGKKQSTSVIDDLTKKYGNLAARKQRQNLKKKAPRPPGMKMGGMSMKSKMASKGGKMGGMMPPGYKKGGSVGRKKTARGVGAAKRGFGKAMR